MNYPRVKTIPKAGSADLSSAALALSSTAPGRTKLAEVTLKASVNITETVTVTKNRVDTNYSVVLDAQNLSSAQNYVFRPTGECILEPGETISVSCTKANNTGVVYSVITLIDLGRV